MVASRIWIQNESNTCIIMVQLNFTAVKGISKDGDQRMQIGNHLQYVDGHIYGVGATTFRVDLLPEFTELNKVVDVKVTFCLEPQEGFTKVWIYGAQKHRRVSSRKPHRGRVHKESIYVAGDWWLDNWCDTEYFPEVETINPHEDLVSKNWFFEAYIKVELL